VLNSRKAWTGEEDKKVGDIWKSVSHWHTPWWKLCQEFTESEQII